MEKLIAIALLLTTTSLCAQTPAEIVKQIEALDLDDGGVSAF